MKAKIGDKLIIVSMKNEPNYTGRFGVVTRIDSLGQLHGTWGGLAIIPQEDKYQIIGEERNDTI